MNEKLFKKLNERVELVSIKNSVKITEADEDNLIFKGLSLNSMLLGEDAPGSRRYWLYNSIVGSREQESNKDKQREEAKAAEKKKDDPKELTKKYEEEFVKLDRHAEMYYDDICEFCDRVKHLEAAYNSETDVDKKVDLRTKIKGAKGELKDLLDEVKKLRKDLAELNFKTPSGVRVKTSFTNLSNDLITRARGLAS